jgi:hypothetical protein
MIFKVADTMEMWFQILGYHVCLSGNLWIVDYRQFATNIKPIINFYSNYTNVYPDLELYQLEVYTSPIYMKQIS